jgi:hypothetical protein
MGVLFIVCFRSRGFRQGEVFIYWTHKGEVGPHHTARIPCHMVGPLACLVAFHVDFFFPRSLISQKNYMETNWVRLTSERSLKVKNMHNKKIYFAVLKPNERGLFRKSSDSMENMSRSIINYQICKNMF